ncbi:MAG: tetratricopeptide repeat protein, partial [Deltaproteobacteria bacterium]|nr:tetratricopeptide repeat protein [Deltaproteobacteria bacterium]
ETQFHRALRLDRRNVTALSGLAKLYFQRSDYPRAAQFGERAVRVAPRRASLHLELGDAYAKALRYDDALAAYRKAQQRGSKAAAGRIAMVDAKLGK